MDLIPKAIELNGKQIETIVNSSFRLNPNPESNPEGKYYDFHLCKIDETIIKSDF
jgi:hypothetical protein